MLNGRITELMEALEGAGQPGDLATLMKEEGGRLALECAQQVGPATRADASDKVYQDAKKTYAPEPRKVFPSNKQNGRGGDSGLTWLYGGPDFLVGIPPENLQPSLSESGMRQNLAENKKATIGNAWARIGKRGAQVIQKWNRIVIKRATFNAYVAGKQKRIGRLKAIFAYTAQMLGQTRIPKWVSVHFDQLQGEGKIIFDVTKLTDRQAPEISFGGSAPGLITNFEDKIAGAVETRSHKVFARTQDIIHGYAADWMAGRRITRKTQPA